MVTALRPGTTNICASADGKTGSMTINVFIPANAYDFKVLSDNSVKITWKAVEGATGYSILRDGKEIASLDTDTLEYVDTYYVDQASEGDEVTYVFRYLVDGQGFRCSKTLTLNKRYKVNYHLPEGAVNNPGNPGYYSKGVGAQLLDPVPADKYFFTGWYSDENYTSQRTAILDTDTGDLDLYALFEENFASRIELITDSSPGDEIDVGSTVNVRAVVYGRNSAIAPEDETYEISATCIPSGEYASAEVVRTEGDKPSLKITGKRAGSITVTATANGKDNGRTVSVKKTYLIKDMVPEKLLITSSEPGKALKVGEQLRLNYSIEPAEADQAVEWISGNSEIASIEKKDGYVTVTAKAVGTVYVSAVSLTDASVRNGYWIEVADNDIAPEEGKELRIIDTAKTPNIYGSSSYGIEDDFEKIEIAAGKTFALKAELLPSESFTSKAVSWSSGNSAVAAVSSAGKVTARSAGYAVITVTSEDGNLEAACRVNVYDPVKSFALDKKTLKLARGNSDTIGVATLLPTTASDVVTFVSSNEDVARVDEYTGKVTAGDQNGTAVITATTAHGEKKAKCTVTVGNPVTSIEVRAKGNATTLAAGKTLQLSAVFNAVDNAPQPLNKSVKWEITGDGNNFATISDKGVLKGIKEGYVTVRATSTTDEVAPENIRELTIGIYVPVTKASFNIKSLTVAPGGVYKLTVNFKTPGGEDPTGSEIGQNKPMDVLFYPNEANDYNIDIQDVPGEPNSVLIYGLKYTRKPVTLYAFYYPYGQSSQ